jgi:hypothetical protein
MLSAVRTAAKRASPQLGASGHQCQIAIAARLALANANGERNQIAASDSCDLDPVVRLTASSAQIAVSRRSRRVDSRAAAVQARPIAQIGDGQSLLNVGAQFRLAFEGATVIEHSYILAVLDLAGGRIIQVNDDCLLALATLLRLLVCILRVEKSVGFGRNQADRITFGERRVGTGDLSWWDVVRHGINRIAGLHFVVSAMITFVIPSAKVPSVPGRIGICQSACLAVRVRTGSITTILAPFFFASRMKGQACRLVLIMFIAQTMMYFE